MTIKDLKKLINNMPDDIEVKINSIQINENELESTDVAEAHYSITQGLLLTPSVISLDMKNEYEVEATDNYKEHQRVIASLSITDIIKASDYIDLLTSLLPDNEVIDEANEIKKPLDEIIVKCRTQKTCPHCKGYLYLSDLPQYAYICPECDENFDKFEVLE